MFRESKALTPLHIDGTNQSWQHMKVADLLHEVQHQRGLGNKSGLLDSCHDTLQVLWRLASLLRLLHFNLQHNLQSVFEPVSGTDAAWKPCLYQAILSGQNMVS